MFEWRCAAAQLWLFEAIFLDEIEQNQEILLKSYNVHHLILTYCLLNYCINLISHLQTPLIIFKSCHSLQFISISQSSIIINEALHCTTNLIFTPCLHFVMHNSAMNKTPVFWAVSGFWLTLHSRNQHMSAIHYSTLQKHASRNLWSSPQRKHK